MFQSKTFVILTGASKGFGQALACSLAREFSQNIPGKESVLVLVARSKKGLDETRRMVATISSDLNVHVVPGDLSDVSNLDKLTSSIFGIVDPKQFSCAVLINNAGSLGDKIKSIPNHTDVNKIRTYMDLNITSSFYLTSRFINHFSAAKNYVIHISSLCGIQPTPSLSLYCTGKAAKDMFHQVLALES
ncbi:sepiapterin reductase-like, partial [Paramuricea clavata]